MNLCPYCRTEIDLNSDNKLFCCGCGTPHHQDCFAENGGCTVFGCSQAPSEEAKIRVSGTDLAAMGTAVGFGATQLGGTPPPPGPASLPPPPPAPTFRQSTVPPGPNFGYGYVPPPPPPPSPAYGNPVYAPQVQYASSPAKSRIGFILLGIFLGAFGVHNFYAGYTGKAVAQLLITVCTCFYGSIVSWIWAVVEVCTIDKDSKNVYFT